MRVPAVLLATLLTALLAAALTGCDGDSEPAGSPSSPAGTPLTAVDTSGLVAARADFCARVAPGAVEDALGAPATDATAYANGDRVALGDGPADVVHEYGCVWTAADGTTARAWVFAPPVTAERARSLLRAAGRGAGCREVQGAPGFGSVSAATRCRASGTVETTFRGLFGDAWLSCSLGSPDLERTGRWCVAVARAAAS